MRPKILFRAEAGESVGHGHVCRCLALASMLQGDFEPVFCARSMPDSLRRRIVAEGFSFQLMEGAVEDLDVMRKHQATLICFDGYQFDDHEFQAVLPHFPVIRVDDFGETDTFSASLIINHNATATPSLYPSFEAEALCLGLPFALIHPTFFKGSETPRAEALFVCLGASDQANITRKVIGRYLGELELQVVVGSSYPHLASLDEFAEHPGFFLHVGLDPDEMARVMARCSVGITAASNTALEFIATGGVAYLIKAIAHQTQFYDALLERGMAFSYDEFRVAPEREAESVCASSSVLDGMAGARFRGRIQQVLS